MIMSHIARGKPQGFPPIPPLPSLSLPYVHPGVLEIVPVGVSHITERFNDLGMFFGFISASPTDVVNIVNLARLLMYASLSNW